MNLETKINKELLWILSLVFLLFIFHDQQIKNSAYRTELHLFTMLFAWLIFALITINTFEPIKLNSFDIAFFLFWFILIITLASNYTNRSDLNIIENVAYSTLLYIPIRVVTTLIISEQFKSLLSWVFIVFVNIILIKALLLCKIITNIHGNLYNSTYFSNYIALFVPLLFLAFKKQQSNILKKATLCTIGLIIIIVLLNNARGSTFALIIFFAFQLKMEWLKKYKVHIFLISVGLIAFSYSIILNKSASISGRLYIWQNSLNILFKNPFGIGLGNFKEIHTIEQLISIKSHWGSEKFLLSDVNDYAFNDFLQFIIEGGIFMIIPFLYIFYLILKSKNHFLISFSAFLIIISFSSYVLHSLPTTLVVVIIFCLLLRHEKKTEISIFFKKTSYYTPLFICLVWSTMAFVAYKTKGLQDKSLVPTSNFYRRLDNKYLYEWGMIEYSRNNYQESIVLMKQSGMMNYDINTNLAIALSYEKMKNYSQAEKYFQKSNNILPRIFKPKYYLLNFYINHRDIKNAKTTANEIIKTPIKVPSPEIDDLKIKASNFIRNKL